MREIRMRCSCGFAKHYTYKEFLWCLQFYLEQAAKDKEGGK
jgi:hypothetical protein